VSRSYYVEIECDVLNATADAILVDYEGEQLWIPRSQVEDSDDFEVGDSEERVVLNVSRWFAEKTGIEAD
jgi:hypothetical protein